MQVQLRDRVHMGDEVRDLVTGFKGIVISLGVYDNGCERVGVRPAKLKRDGTLSECEWFDEPALKILKKCKVRMFTPPPGKPGGPHRPTPTLGMNPHR
jgi:hypothetical protein